MPTAQNMEQRIRDLGTRQSALSSAADTLQHDWQNFMSETRKGLTDVLNDVSEIHTLYTQAVSDILNPTIPADMMRQNTRNKVLQIQNIQNRLAQDIGKLRNQTL